MTKQDYDRCFEYNLHDCKKCSDKLCEWWDIENEYNEKEKFMIKASRFYPTIISELNELIEQHDVFEVYKKGLSDMYDYMKSVITDNDVQDAGKTLKYDCGW